MRWVVLEYLKVSVLVRVIVERVVFVSVVSEPMVIAVWVPALFELECVRYVV